MRPGEANSYTPPPLILASGNYCRVMRMPRKSLWIADVSFALCPFFWRGRRYFAEGLEEVIRVNRGRLAPGPCVSTSGVHLFFAWAMMSRFCVSLLPETVGDYHANKIGEFRLGTLLCRCHTLGFIVVKFQMERLSASTK